MYNITIDGKQVDFDELMNTYFDKDEIQVIKDTIKCGFWGDADFEFGDITVCTYGYITQDAKEAGNFKGRIISQLFNQINKKVYKDGKHIIPFICHIHDWWGDGSGSIFAINTHDHDLLRNWATK